MTEQVAVSLRGRNPDVLTCIANLSNDEVFTPPALANQMHLPTELRPGFDELLRSDVALPHPDIVAELDNAAKALADFGESLG